jgi:xanthine dehydrogenase YagS FAD-binding subunit
VETALERGELITAVELPAMVGPVKQTYLKVRDRASYEFALASVAVVVWMEGDSIASARLALGGVATVPWRAADAEKLLAGKKADSALFRSVAEAALKDARPLKYNAFKVELARRAIERALADVTA